MNSSEGTDGRRFLVWESDQPELWGSIVEKANDHEEAAIAYAEMNDEDAPHSRALFVREVGAGVEGVAEALSFSLESETVRTWRVVSKGKLT